MIANCSSRHVRCRSMRDHLLDPVRTDHGKGADETGADTDRDSGTKTNFGKGRERRLGVNVGCEKLVFSMSKESRRMKKDRTEGAGGSVVLRHHDRMWVSS